MTRTYCRVAGVVLLALGVLGILGFGIDGFLSIDEPAEIAFHFVTGALAAYAGFSGGGYGAWADRYAKWFGVIYLALGVVGFVVPDILGLFHFDLGCNLAHLVLGAWGIWAGFFAKQSAAAPAM